MNRGIFGSLLNQKGYIDSSKEWYIELLQSDMCWYELIVNEHKDIATKKQIFSRMKQLKEKVESNLEKRFVYFICSRKKIRFCTNTAPSLLSDGSLKLILKIGKEEELREINVDALYEESGVPAKIEIENEGRFIYFTHSNGQKLAFSIHDFLLEFKVNLGIDSVVQYVGYTKNPNSRPLNGEHGGLNEVLYKVSIEDNDILFFFNFFKVMTSAENNEFNIHFAVANSMTDEVKVDREGLVIEKCFIFYFDSKNQTKNKVKEKKEIENDLLKFAKNHKIGSVAIHFEVDDESEYYKFSSSRIEAKHQHVFTTQLKNGHLEIKSGADLFDKHIKQWT